MALLINNGLRLKNGARVGEPDESCCCDDEGGGGEEPACLDCSGCCFSSDVTATGTWSITQGAVTNEQGVSAADIGAMPAGAQSGSFSLNIVSTGDKTCAYTTDGDGQEGAPNYGNPYLTYQKDTCTFHIEPFWRVVQTPLAYLDYATVSDGPVYTEYWIVGEVNGSGGDCDCCGGSGSVTQTGILCFCYDKVSGSLVGFASFNSGGGSWSVTISPSSCCRDELTGLCDDRLPLDCDNDCADEGI